MDQHRTSIQKKSKSKKEDAYKRCINITDSTGWYFFFLLLFIYFFLSEKCHLLFEGGLPNVIKWGMTF